MSVSPNSARLYASALLLALAGSIGSVWLSVGMDLRACPLCFYQRTAAFLACATLLLGWRGGHLVSRSSAALLTLPACVLGLGVAIFHVYLEASATLECPQGLLGLGTAPQQSLALFVLLTPVTLLTARADRAVGWRRIGFACLLGAVACGASIRSSPPLPKAPAGGYEGVVFDTCRRVWTG